MKFEAREGPVHSKQKLKKNITSQASYMRMETRWHLKYSLSSLNQHCPPLRTVGVDTVACFRFEHKTLTKLLAVSFALVISAAFVPKDPGGTAVRGKSWAPVVDIQRKSAVTVEG